VSATAHDTAKKRANSFAQPTTMIAAKIAQHTSWSNKPRQLRRACSCERRSGFISCRLGIKGEYSHSHPAASGRRGRGADLRVCGRRPIGHLLQGDWRAILGLLQAEPPLVRGLPERPQFATGAFCV
jgi:hypothetical protein